jgi:hypothetical protein
MHKNSWTLRTLAAQALGHIDAQTKAVVPPLHVSTTYVRDPDNAYRAGLIYGRPDNETSTPHSCRRGLLERRTPPEQPLLRVHPARLLTRRGVFRFRRSAAW